MHNYEIYDEEGNTFTYQIGCIAVVVLTLNSFLSSTQAIFDSKNQPAEFYEIKNLKCLSMLSLSDLLYR